MKPSYKFTTNKFTTKIEAISTLETLLICVKNKDADFSVTILKYIDELWSAVHWAVQDLEPEITIDVEKHYEPISGNYYAKIPCSDEPDDFVEATGKLGNEQILVNPNDFTVMRIRYYEKL